MLCSTLQLSLIAQLPLAQAGQLLLVVGIAFSVIVLISSTYRFHRMVQLSEDELVTTEDCNDFFFIQVTRYLSKINRASSGFGIFIAQFRAAEADQRTLQEKLLKTIGRDVRGIHDKPCLFRDDCVAVIIDTEEQNVPAVARRIMNDLRATARSTPGILALRAGATSFPMHGLSTQILIDATTGAMESVDYEAALPFRMAPVPTQENDDPNEAEPLGELSKEDKNSALDPLTGVLRPTVIGSYMRKYLSEIRRKKDPAAVLCIGINRIDQIIHMHGELAADDVIAGVSRVLQRLTRDCDLIGRYHRDDFLILAPCSLKQGEQVANRLREAVQKELFISGTKRIKTSVSVGIAGHPEHGRNLRDLFRCAYLTLELVREWNTSACLIYDPAQHAKKADHATGS
jgi:diguanylate cyclase (GGDEF)-like protein